MPEAIIECVPNFSEARRPEVVEAIMQIIAETPGVHLLDRHSDLDHNRTVLTFAGSPDGVEQAAFQAIARAAELIDLDQHTGAHPRIGATDVVPFVPISGVTMQDCIEIAYRLGQRVGQELGIPVYLYEEAATRPERRNLENLRRGQYEGLKEAIQSDPERLPDFGPARLPKAGATVIGARQFLIAYNIYLTTQDVTVAQNIARAIRNSNGGMRYLKALGLLVEGRAQVSMNLTNFRETPLARVQELVRREAERYGAAIHHSELVGLIPEAALRDAAIWYLQLDSFEANQVLQRRLHTAMAQVPTTSTATPTTFLDALAGGAPASTAFLAALAGGDPASTAFLDALASGDPSPGGGSAAAYSGAAAAALVAMVCRLTVGKKKYAAVESRMQHILAEAETLRSSMTTAVERDATAFNAVMEAFRLPRNTPQEQQARQDVIREATLQAARVPLEVARQAVDVMALAVEVIAHGNLNAISDGASGAAQARAALTAAGYNVRINLKDLPDHPETPAMLSELRQLEARAAALESQIQQTLTERGGFPTP